VVAFYGVVLDGPGDSVATVTEYMTNGSLRNALQKNERYCVCVQTFIRIFMRCLSNSSFHYPYLILFNFLFP
jgi:hypothetical protein